MKPRKTTRNNRNDRLEEAMSLLIQSQAALMQNQTASSQQQTAFLARLADQEKELTELRRQTDERFGRIETILLELMRMMEALPEAIREKIGFKPSR